jgi:hypothetical protein
MIEENEIVATMKDAAERLNDLGINYMVKGSVALGVYVPARTTFDIDILVEMNSADAARFERKFVQDYYVDASSIVRANEHQSIFNIINRSTLVKVDCIVKKRDRFELEKFSRRQSAEVGGVEFWVIGKEDLILSKLKWAAGSHSPKQFEDIERLLETGVDEQFLSDNIEEMDLREVWEAFGRWKIQARK